MPFKRPTCLSSPDYEDEREDLKSRRPPQAHQPDDNLQLVPTNEKDDIPDDERGSCVVNLVKREGEILGLTVSGGSDREGRPKVANLRSTGIAAKSDLLQTEDLITSVNGIRTSRLKHAEIISLLKNIGDDVTLQVEYQLPPTAVSNSKIIQKTCDVTLRRDRDNGSSFGFVLRGGSNARHCLSRPLVVTHVREGSSAEKEGSMKTGDRVIAVDSFPFINTSLEEALNKIADISDDDVTFTIEYDVSVMDSVSKSSGALMVEVFKAPCEELGISLTKSTRAGRIVVCIDRVKPASIADRCGALHVGDQILSIDAVSMTQQSVNLREASELLQSSSDQLKIEILPFSRRAIANTPFTERFGASVSSSRSLIASSSRSLFPGGHLTIGRSEQRWNRSQRRQIASNRPQYRSAMSLALSDSKPSQVSHTESHHVRLTSQDVYANDVSATFGIQLFTSVFTTEVLGTPPVIAAVDPDRSADLCGVLQAGDRLTSVNGFICEELSVDEVNQLLIEAHRSGQVDLELEFDVADSVVPSSGVFHIKLPTRRGIPLGIELTGDEPGHEIMIKQITKGSAAYRSGTLAVGDQILAIDGFRWLASGLGLNVDYARTLLNNADDVVRLKVHKISDDESEEDTDAVTYTVELKRQGGPLGITISGTEDPSDPIIISHLTPNSLAARTGAIHEGDEILSINDAKLRYLSLDEAVAALRHSPDVVTFKIRRAPITYDVTPPITSSADNTITLNEEESKMTSLARDESSDPEDDILPPPMTCLNTPMTSQNSGAIIAKTTSDVTKVTNELMTSQLTGSTSVDSAVESWIGSSPELHHRRHSNNQNQKEDTKVDRLFENTLPASEAETTAKVKTRAERRARHQQKMRAEAMTSAATADVRSKR